MGSMDNLNCLVVAAALQEADLAEGFMFSLAGLHDRKIGLASGVDSQPVQQSELSSTETETETQAGITFQD